MFASFHWFQGFSRIFDDFAPFCHREAASHFGKIRKFQREIHLARPFGAYRDDFQGLVNFVTGQLHRTSRKYRHLRSKSPSVGAPRIFMFLCQYRFVPTMLLRLNSRKWELHIRLVFPLYFQNPVFFFVKFSSKFLDLNSQCPIT